MTVGVVHAVQDEEVVADAAAPTAKQDQRVAAPGAGRVALAGTRPCLRGVGSWMEGLCRGYSFALPTCDK